MKKVNEKEVAAMNEGIARQVFYLGPHEEAVKKRARVLAGEHFVGRLGRKDGDLWNGDEKRHDQIKGSLGRLDAPSKMTANVKGLYEFAADALSAGLKEAVLMGMGGSSLAPLLFARTFPREPGGMPVHVLDTTDPATVLAIERAVKLEETLFVVASKSGSTAEPNAFNQYFYSKVEAVRGPVAGGNFAAITDRGSALEALGKERCFRGIIENYKDIGGRYSALSYFGLLPAALMGLDVDKLVLRALRMAKACTLAQPMSENPGVMLGAAMGELALMGMDKTTFLIAEPLRTLGLWLEQLIAESLGKEGLGILPVVDEPPASPSAYGEDRFFVALLLKGHADPAVEKAVEALKRAKRPVVVIRLNDLYDVAQEFFRFEIATATAGAILGVNPFDQPNVQESKDVTKGLLHEIETTGRFAEPDPTATEDGIALFGEGGGSSEDLLKALFSSARPGDYCAILAYLTETTSATEIFQEMRAAIRDGLGVATTLGYGPRFLHSTGQFHKGGPNTGLFIQFTADDEEDAVIPDAGYSFGTLKRAQAVGDMEALKRHGRRIVRIHLGKMGPEGLKTAKDMILKALPVRG